MTAVGIVAFVVALTLSIALHEAGHLIMAKRFGMKATAYFIGFGPKIFSFRRGETEYGLKAIPAGGYVKIVGMSPLEETEPGDEPRLFWRQAAPQRSVVLAAGSAVHFLIAVVLTFTALAVLGTPTADTTRVGTVAAQCIPRVDPAAACAPGDPASPAAAAGFHSGDQVLSLNGRPVRSWTAFASAVRASPPGPVTVTVRRAGRTVTLHPDLVQVLRNPATGQAGATPVSAIGLGPALVVHRRSVLRAVTGTGQILGAEVVGTYDVFAHKLGDLANLFNRHRDPNGFVGVVGIARVSGETFAATSTPLAARLAGFLSLIAGLNMFVGIFNLLPLLPLDGGHLAILAFEQARSRLARLVRRPDPGRVNMNKVMPVAYVVIMLVVVLAVATLTADIVNPIRLQ